MNPIEQPDNHPGFPDAAAGTPALQRAEAEAMSWQRTWALIRSDMQRLATHLQRPDSLSHRAYFALLPGFQVLFWHRIARWLFVNGWARSARLLFLFSIYLTRAEIPPTTSLGESALITHATCVNVFGKVGARLTMNGNAGFGGGFGARDIGGGPGYPVVGDDVVMAYGAQVMGPVLIGSGAHIGPGALVTTDVPPGALVLWQQARIIQGGATRAAPQAGDST